MFTADFRSRIKPNIAVRALLKRAGNACSSITTSVVRREENKTRLCDGTKTAVPWANHLCARASGLSRACVPAISPPFPVYPGPFRLVLLYAALLEQKK